MNMLDILKLMERLGIKCFIHNNGTVSFVDPDFGDIGCTMFIQEKVDYNIFGKGEKKSPIYLPFSDFESGSHFSLISPDKLFGINISGLEKKEAPKKEPVKKETRNLKKLRKRNMMKIYEEADEEKSLMVNHMVYYIGDKKYTADLEFGILQEFVDNKIRFVPVAGLRVKSFTVDNGVTSKEFKGVCVRTDGSMEFNINGKRENCFGEFDKDGVLETPERLEAINSNEILDVLIDYYEKQFPQFKTTIEKAKQDLSMTKVMVPKNN